MKLFYTPVERMLLSIDNRCTVAMSDVLWDTAKAVFDKYRSKQKHGSRLSDKELRILLHVEWLLGIVSLDAI